MLRCGLAAYRSHRALLVTRPPSHRSLATLPDSDALDAVHNVDDFQRLARDKLERPLYEYLASGSGDEVTLRENRTAFGRYALRPRALRPVDALSTACELFGAALALLSLVGLLVYATATPEAQEQPHMRLLRCVRALRIFRLAQVGW